MLNDDQWQALRESFALEAEELIQRAEQELGVLEEDPSDSEAVNSLFRAVHTLKGSAGLLSLDALVSFTHEFETVLMRARDGDINLDAGLVRLSLRCVDHLANLLESLDQPGSMVEAPELLAALRAYQGGMPAQQEATGEWTRELPEDGDGIWHVSLRFDPEFFLHGFDPASFLRYLDRVCHLVDVYTVLDALPEAPEAFDPERCYLGLEVRVDQVENRAQLEDVFEFVRDLAQIRMLPPASTLDDYLKLIESLPEDDIRLGEMLVRVGALTEAELERMLARQNQSQARPLGEHLVETETVTPQVVDAALGRQQQIRDRKRSESSFLRVSAERMDALINQVGELVIAAAGSDILAQRSEDTALRESLAEVQRHVEQIRETALQLRMVEIGDTFHRFHRVVREAADALGKDIRLQISGADTDLDKTLVDRIYEPLVHLVRNAIDHGLETAEERQRNGKSAQGRVGLDAYHETGTVVIEVSDDGRGIDPQRIRQKAVERELIDEDAVLDEQEILQLIFHPGFSTAESVTNLSGRGVGMDSVRKDIDALRGSLEIDNRPGQGCCFRIRLPLTLAIIDGFLFGVGGQSFVVPLGAVAECVEARQVEGVPDMTGFRDLRGRALPFVDLSRLFHLQTGARGRQSLLVLRQGDATAGLCVDRLHGEFQTVIKPLGPLFDHLPALAGSTILGSGEVALILDVQGLLALAKSTADASHRHALVSASNH